MKKQIEELQQLLEHHAAAGEITAEGRRQLRVHAHRLAYDDVPTDQGLADLDRIALRLHELTEQVDPKLFRDVQKAADAIHSARAALAHLLAKLPAEKGEQ